MSRRALALTILFQDDDLVAVAKPSGLATIPGRGETDSLLERLARELHLSHTGTADPRLRVVHRLDKETSGVIVFAKNRATQQHLSHQFQNNAVEKEYLALVIGRPDTPEGEIDAPIGLHPTDGKRMAVRKHGGRPARTLWKLQERFREFSLVRVFPKTGKTHQIRVHLKHAGMPVVNDLVYGPPAEAGTPKGLFLSQFKREYRPTRGGEERALIARLALHAQRLRVSDPSGAVLDLEAPLPKDFSATLNQLRKHSSGR